MGPNTGTSFFATANTGNYWGSTVGVVDYEWLCLQDEFCSYLPTEYGGGTGTTSFSTITDFRSREGRTNDVGAFVIDDGSAAYGDLPCPSESNCPAVILASSGSKSQTASCPLGSKMMLTIWTAEEMLISFVLGSDVLFLSASGNCPSVGSSVSCSGLVATINVTSVVQPCETFPCDFPTTGYAHGLCQALQTCSNKNVSDTLEGGNDVPMPNITEMLDAIMSNQTYIQAGFERIESMQATLERILDMLLQEEGNETETSLPSFSASPSTTDVVTSTPSTANTMSSSPEGTNTETTFPFTTNIVTLSPSIADSVIDGFVENIISAETSSKSPKWSGSPTHTKQSGAFLLFPICLMFWLLK